MTDRISVRRSFYRAGSQAFQGTCTVCSAPFLTGYEATLYCSDACRQRAHRQRQAQQSAELPVRRRRRQSTLAPSKPWPTPWSPPPLLDRAMAGDKQAARQFLHEAGFTDASGNWLPHFQPLEETDD